MRKYQRRKRGARGGAEEGVRRRLRRRPWCGTRGGARVKRVCSWANYVSGVMSKGKKLIFLF